MKKRLPVKLMTIAILSAVLSVGCAGQASKEGGKTASKASPEAIAAIENAAEAIAAAKANDWIWRDTEAYLQEARVAANKGDNDTAVQLAEKARFQAEAAIIQYNYEEDHPRGL
jgi:hypothetical protein